MNCPRCAQPLAEHQLDSFVFRLCGACKGILGKHEDVMQVVDKSWRAVPEHTAEETPLYANPAIAQEPVFHCPDCQQAMEKYGYMGLAAITIDRCDACSLLWLDSDELQNMVLAMARDQYRQERELSEERKSLLDLGGGVIPPVGTGPSLWLFGGRRTGLPVLAVELVLRVLG